MNCSNGNMIDMVRGDTKRLFFYRKDISGHVITTKADKVFFTVKRSEFDESPLFQKILNHGITFNEDFSYSLRITPEDTNRLEYGEYVYDIEIINLMGSKRTIAKGKFNLTWESTWQVNEA